MALTVKFVDLEKKFLDSISYKCGKQLSENRVPGTIAAIAGTQEMTHYKTVLTHEALQSPEPASELSQRLTDTPPSTTKALPVVKSEASEAR